MSVIAQLREIVAEIDASIYVGSIGDKNWEKIDGIIDEYEPQGYTMTCVDTRFEEGGRWANEEIDVYKITEDNGDVAYFEIRREVPATEMQDGGSFSFWIDEVEPRQVTITKYFPKEAVVSQRQ
ncbi:hypothetical protein [Paenibacillus dendritiformis]|uniref:hypothetical protein n=1 Tax=Paenibacillus dendritiformis TaxID=130049 RepID=UPI00387E0FC4